MLSVACVWVKIVILEWQEAFNFISTIYIHAKKNMLKAIITLPSKNLALTNLQPLWKQSRSFRQAMLWSVILIKTLDYYRKWNCKFISSFVILNWFYFNFLLILCVYNECVLMLLLQISFNNLVHKIVLLSKTWPPWLWTLLPFFIWSMN